MSRDRRTVVIVVVASLALVGALSGVGTALVWRHLDRNLHRLDAVGGPRPDNLAVGGSREPLDVLVMGSDSRDCAGCAIDRHVGEGERSDTTVLLHVSADRSRAYGVSIPRDLLVDRPRCQAADGGSEPPASTVMWNDAFAVGGPTCTVRQVEAMTGIRLEHYLVVDFAGFRRMVAALGGVEVCIPQPIDDAAHGIVLPAGTRRLGPDEAEDYIRERHALSYGTDTGRVKRQQAFMAAMAHQALSGGLVTHPTRLYDFLDAVTGSISLDPDLHGLADLVDLARDLGGLGSDGVRFLTMPSHESDGGRVVATEPQADRLWSLLAHDEVLPARLAAGSISAGAVPGSGRRDRGPGAATPEELGYAGLCS